MIRRAKEFWLPPEISLSALLHFYPTSASPPCCWGVIQQMVSGFLSSFHPISVTRMYNIHGSQCLECIRHLIPRMHFLDCARFPECNPGKGFLASQAVKSAITVTIQSFQDKIFRSGLSVPALVFLGENASILARADPVLFLRSDKIRLVQAVHDRAFPALYLSTKVVIRFLVAGDDMETAMWNQIQLFSMLLSKPKPGMQKLFHGVRTLYFFFKKDVTVICY